MQQLDGSPNKTGSDLLMDSITSPTHPKKKPTLTLPEIGSFSLIQDLVKDYTDLSKKQDNERRKLDFDSQRGYNGSLRATKAGRSASWVDRKSQSNIEGWGTEASTRGRSLNKPSILLEDTNQRVGRFRTSNKAWLDSYESVKKDYEKKKVHDNGRMNTSVGRALFNLKRTLPPSTKDEANSFIKQRTRVVSPVSISQISSPKRLSHFLSTS